MARYTASYCQSKIRKCNLKREKIEKDIDTLLSIVPTIEEAHDTLTKGIEKAEGCLKIVNAAWTGADASSCKITISDDIDKYNQVKGYFTQLREEMSYAKISLNKELDKMIREKNTWQREYYNAIKD